MMESEIVSMKIHAVACPTNIVIAIKFCNFRFVSLKSQNFSSNSFNFK